MLRSKMAAQLLKAFNTVTTDRACEGKAVPMYHVPMACQAWWPAERLTTAWAPVQFLRQVLVRSQDLQDNGRQISQHLGLYTSIKMPNNCSRQTLLESKSFAKRHDKNCKIYSDKRDGCVLSIELNTNLWSANMTYNPDIVDLICHQ